MTSEARLRQNRARVYARDRALRSGLEHHVRDLLHRTGLPHTYEGVRLSYFSRREYIPDFMIAGKMVIEVKGFFDVEDRRKLREVKAHHPEIDFRIVFDNPYTFLSKQDRDAFKRWLEKEHGRKRGGPEYIAQWKSVTKRKGAVVTYADWAEKHGFPWAAKEIPSEWIEDAREYLREGS